jgi:hypothetical protein
MIHVFINSSSGNAPGGRITAGWGARLLKGLIAQPATPAATPFTNCRREILNIDNLLSVVMYSPFRRSCRLAPASTPFFCHLLPAKVPNLKEIPSWGQDPAHSRQKVQSL